MEQFGSMTQIKPYLRKFQAEGKTVGLVPTMGYLHEGHLSLIRRAVAENDLAVVSIFVNPIQFGPREDLDNYPRDLKRDLQLIASVGAKVVFTPSAKEMYGADFRTYVQVTGLTDHLCGRSRPGHFQGVTTVVTKLFNIVRPDKAYFGQKDAQQALVIRKMMRDLNGDPEVIICPIVREADGLAMSSRNVYLSGAQRRQATILYQALSAARQMIDAGERRAIRVTEEMTKLITSQPLAEIDYVAVVDADTLTDLNQISGAILIAVAVKFGSTRLIDNIIVEV